jgi:hypothetical protein
LWHRISTFPRVRYSDVACPKIGKLTDVACPKISNSLMSPIQKLAIEAVKLQFLIGVVEPSGGVKVEAHNSMNRN